MISRPIIFISAVSRELRSARDLVAKTLLALGYEPKWQDIAATDAGDLRAVLRKWVDGSDAVLQLVGHCYGFAPQTADPQFGPCSYTQYEALYARQQRKPVYYIFTDDAHPTDGCGCAPKTLHDLQTQYRQSIKSYGDLRYTTSSLTETELLVRRLKDDLAALHAEWEAHRTRIEGDLALTVSATSQLLDGQHRQEAAFADFRQKMESLVRGGSEAKLTQDYDAALAFIASRHAMSAAALRTLLAQRADRVVGDAHAELREKVRVLREAGRFTEARDFAVEAAARLERTRQQSTKDEIEMLIEACTSEVTLGHYAQARIHADKADRLTNREQDFETWAAARNCLGGMLGLEGHFRESLTLYRELLPWSELRRGAEHPETLKIRNNLGLALNEQGNFVEGETEHRAVLAISERALGAEHPDVALSCYNLALCLETLGRKQEALVFARRALDGWRKALGAEHPRTKLAEELVARLSGAAK